MQLAFALTVSVQEVVSVQPRVADDSGGIATGFSTPDAATTATRRPSWAPVLADQQHMQHSQPLSPNLARRRSSGWWVPGDENWKKKLNNNKEFRVGKLGQVRVFRQGHPAASELVVGADKVGKLEEIAREITTLERMIERREQLLSELGVVPSWEIEDDENEEVEDNRSNLSAMGGLIVASQLCAFCEKNVGQTACPECELLYCPSCFQKIHEHGGLSEHGKTTRYQPFTLMLLRLHWDITEARKLMCGLMVGVIEMLKEVLKDRKLVLLNVEIHCLEKEASQMRKIEMDIPREKFNHILEITEAFEKKGCFIHSMKSLDGFAINASFIETIYSTLHLRFAPLQALFRRYLYRNSYLSIKKSVQRLQAYVRSWFDRNADGSNHDNNYASSQSMRTAASFSKEALEVLFDQNSDSFSVTGSSLMETGMFLDLESLSDGSDIMVKASEWQMDDEQIGIDCNIVQVYAIPSRKTAAATTRLSKYPQPPSKERPDNAYSHVFPVE